MRCKYCTNKIILNTATDMWEDQLGTGCVASSSGIHTPVGKP